MGFVNVSLDQYDGVEQIMGNIGEEAIREKVKAGETNPGTFPSQGA